MAPILRITVFLILIEMRKALNSYIRSSYDRQDDERRTLTQIYLLK